uniref:Trp operon repressor n=1 Tax=Shewanella putrefaciens (strain 200) TaxID=399804 RepID=E6XIC7_SHEP2
MRANWDLVLNKILSHGNYEDLFMLLHLLLTEDERSAIAGRLKVFQLLLNSEMSQRQIAAEFKVSIATITRCSNYLKNMTPEHRAKIQTLIS